MAGFFSARRKENGDSIWRGISAHLRTNLVRLVFQKDCTAVSDVERYGCGIPLAGKMGGAFCAAKRRFPRQSRASLRRSGAVFSKENIPLGFLRRIAAHFRFPLQGDIPPETPAPQRARTRFFPPISPLCNKTSSMLQLYYKQPHPLEILSPECYLSITKQAKL